MCLRCGVCFLTAPTFEMPAWTFLAQGPRRIWWQLGLSDCVRPPLRRQRLCRRAVDVSKRESQTGRPTWILCGLCADARLHPRRHSRGTLCCMPALALCSMQQLLPTGLGSGGSLRTSRLSSTSDRVPHDGRRNGTAESSRQIVVSRKEVLLRRRASIRQLRLVASIGPL